MSVYDSDTCYSFFWGGGGGIGWMSTLTDGMGGLGMDGLTFSVAISCAEYRSIVLSSRQSQMN